MKNLTLACILPAALLLAPALVTAQDHDPAAATALVIIDIQEFYYPGGAMPLVEPEAASANAALLLAKSRADGHRIVHVGHNADQGKDFHADVAPREGEAVVFKDEVNAFKNTDLGTLLAEWDVKRIVICGMQTHMCLEAATRAASDLGYEVIVVGDACATRDLKYGDTLVPASEVHASTLATLDRVYGRVLDTEEALAEY